MDYSKVYDILERYGAFPGMRQSFISSHENERYQCKEWRFQGVFGFGGKWYSEYNRVSYYREDETPEREEKLSLVNSELKRLTPDA